MNNSEQPAFPLTFDAETIKEINNGLKKNKGGKLQLEGLSKREYAAIKAMQGMLANPAYTTILQNSFAKNPDFDMNEMCAMEARDMADELLKQLEK